MRFCIIFKLNATNLLYEQNMNSKEIEIILLDYSFLEFNKSYFEN